MKLVYFSWVRERIGREEETVDLPEFSYWFMYDQNLSAHVERMAYSIWHGH